MIATLVRRIALALALLVRRAAHIMNVNLVVHAAPQRYLVPQRVAGARRHQQRGFDARGRST